MKKLSTLLLSTTLSISTALPIAQALMPITIMAEDEPDVWDGLPSVDDLTKATEGENEGKYVISTGAQLAKLVQNVNSGNTYQGESFVLTSDINLDGKEWTPIGGQTTPFRGSFNGQNHTISNLTITNSNAFTGLFGNTAQANGDETPGTIEDLTLDGVTITNGGLYVGALIGMPFTTNVEGITLSGKVQISGTAYVGGLLGYNFYGQGSNLTVNADAGSLVQANSYINSEDYLTYVGGIVGHVGEGSVTRLSECKSNINVQGDVGYVGGIAGVINYGNTFSSCTCTGNVYLVGNTKNLVEYGLGGIAGTYNFANEQIETITGSFDGKLYFGSSIEEAEAADTNSMPGFDPNSLVGSPHNNGTPDITSSNAGTLKLGSGTVSDAVSQVAYVGNTYYSDVQTALDQCPVGSSLQLLANVEPTDESEPSVTINRLIGVSSNGFTSTGISIGEDVKDYLKYEKQDGNDEETNSGTDNIVCTYNFVTSITITADPSSTTTGENIALTATLTYNDKDNPLNPAPALIWSSTPNGATITPGDPTTTSTVTSTTAGSYIVSATLEDQSTTLPDITINTATVRFTAPYTPPTSGSGGTQPEPEPEPEPTPPSNSPNDTPVTDNDNNSADFEPNSGTNAGVSGDGQGFTEEGSQTLTDSDGNAVTFTQNQDGTKAASTQNSDGEVTSSVVTVPQTSITDNTASVSLGTNASGETLGIVGNKVTESSAPSLTINLPDTNVETKVTLPIVEGTIDSGTVAMLVGENGELTPIITTTINGDNSTITIPLTGSQKVVILNNSLSFTDSSGVPAYATQAAAYTSARRLMTGMGESSPKPFDYNGQTSRGQFATILYRLEGEPSVSGAYPDGVVPGAWNANAARWAVENGYMGKGGSAFNPQADITRNQIIAIVYRMNGAPAADQSVLDKYSDAGLIPEGDFRDAMAWGVSKGIIGQGVTTLDPEDDASRAEIAAMIQRIIENLY